MRAFVLGAAMWLCALPALADARLTVLVDVLKLDEATLILRDEGLAYAAQLNDDMLGGQGGPGFSQQADAIYSAQRMSETVRAALGAELEGDLLEDAITFYGSDLGQRIVTLENSARAAISDPGIEEAARGRYASLKDSDDARLALLRDLVAAGDLVTRNVTSAMNANVQFIRGLAEGGGSDMTDDEILADVGGQMEEITEDTEGWMYGYFLLAYHPLTDDEVSSYVKFARTPAGAALNRALFAGFGTAYEDISYGLGRAIALNMVAQEL